MASITPIYISLMKITMDCPSEFIHFPGSSVCPLGNLPRQQYYIYRWQSILHSIIHANRWERQIQRRICYEFKTDSFTQHWMKTTGKLY